MQCGVKTLEHYAAPEPRGDGPGDSQHWPQPASQQLYVRFESRSGLRYLLPSLHRIAERKTGKTRRDRGRKPGALVNQDSRRGNTEAPAPEQLPSQQARALPASDADVQQRLSSPHCPVYLTTMLTRGFARQKLFSALTLIEPT